jgi:HEAT repeat protein
MRPHRRTRTLPALTAALLAVSASFARAQSEEEPPGKDLDELVARLRNPFFAKQADRDLQIVQLLLRQKSAKADAYLRDLLADTGAHPTVVEQIVTATLIDADHRLLPDVVERLRREAGSALDRALDVAFLTYSDAALVQRLVVLASDDKRSAEFRVEAVEVLGRTGNPEALDALLDLWGGPRRELREPAARAFERILPVNAASREEAQSARESIRGIPFSEALRRLVRKGGARPLPVASRDVEADYVRLASQMLPSATLQQVIESYLPSSVPAVRAMAARRIAEFPFETSEATDEKVRAARECLAALRREDVESVELEIIAALTTRAQELRGAVGKEDLDALTARVRLGGRSSNAVRLASVRLLGDLRERDAAPVMREAFENLKDGDVELRLALLDALQQAPEDVTAWLIARLSVETHSRVVRKIVVLLNRASDPSAAIDAFTRLLASHADQQVRWDVAKSLGTLWATRQLPAARDALMGAGLADIDATVRRTSAASLAADGPGRDRVIERLRKVLESDPDMKVREAAAKAVVDLDETAAAKNLLPYLADDLDVWRLYRDHLVEDVRRRDKTPERVLAACDVLAEHGLRRLAVDLLTLVSAAHDGLWENEGGRGALLERLASLLLDQGDPDGARAAAQELVDLTPRDAGPARRRAELLLATAFCRSGRSDELADARRMLDALRYVEDLPAERRAEAAVELGDCLLRMSDPAAAVVVLSPVAARADLSAALVKRASVLLDDAKRRAEEDRKRIVAWVDALEGPQAAEAQAGLRGFGARAALPVVALFDDAKDAASVRKLMRACAALTGKPAGDLRDDASAADIARAAEDAKSALRAYAQRGGDASGGSR